MARNRIIPTKKRNLEVESLIRRYNNKIYRLKRSGADVILPEKLTKQTRRDILRSRNAQEYNRKIREYSKFLKRGYEKTVKLDGLNIPKAKAEIIKTYQRKLRKQTTDIIDYFENTQMTYKGKKQINLLTETLDTRYQNALIKKKKLLDDIDFSSMDIKDIDNYIERLRNNITGISYKKWQNTYIGMISDVGITYDVDRDIIDKITSKLEKIKPEEFNKLYYTESLIKDIMFRYRKIKDVELESEQNDVQELFGELEKSIDTIIKDYV